MGMVPHTRSTPRSGRRDDELTDPRSWRRHAGVALAGVKVVRPVGRSTLTPAAADAAKNRPGEQPREQRAGRSNLAPTQMGCSSRG
jgi:hypothetical protein